MDAKIKAALELLNASAKEKGQELQDMVVDKYDHLKNVLAKSGRDVFTEGRDFVKENPWIVVGSIAAAVAAVGVALALLQKNKEG